MLLTTNEPVAGLQISKDFSVAGMAVLIFDYIITLGDEAEWMWGRRWDATRLIFTVSRYLPFVGVGIAMYSAFIPISELCRLNLAENVVRMVGIIAAEVLLVLRTYAYWRGDKRVLFGLLTYGGISICAAVAIIITRAQLIPGGKSQGGRSHPGCLLASSRNSTFTYLFLLIFEMTILVLTMYKHFRTYREVKSPIVYTTYRDGMFYIVCIILITSVNVLAEGLFPFQFSSMLDLPQLAIHSVLASRIMFNLRKSSYHVQQEETADQMFDPILVGTVTISISGRTFAELAVSWEN